jgi:MreB/Mrl family cell shape determining protein
MNKNGYSMRSVFSLFSSDLAIDLGTANTLVFAHSKGVVVNEPSIVAINKATGEVVAVGREAKDMLGRTPGNVVAIKPMKDGVIADFKVTEKMLTHFIQKAHNRRVLVHPRIVIGVPSEITPVEKRAVQDSAYRARASEVYLVEQAMAAAIGAGLPIDEPSGNMVVDIGGGTTDIAVFGGGAIRHTAVIPIAGDQITNDIAVSMRTPTQYAEDIKIKYACALSQLANPDETIEVPSVGDRPPRRLARQTLAEIVEPRYEELFGLIRDELRRAGLEEQVATGIVLTGGSAKMEGAIELAEEVFHMPVRLGIPQYVTGLSEVVSNPIHATGVGLLLYAKSNMDMQRAEAPLLAGGMKNLLERMKAWFQGNF